MSHSPALTQLEEAEQVIEAIEAVHTSKQRRGSLQAHIQAMEILEQRLERYRQRYPNVSKSVQKSSAENS